MITVQINDVDKSDLISWSSFKIITALTKEVDVLNFTITCHDGQTYKPDLSDEVEVYNGVVKIYGGIVIEVNERINGLVRTVDVVCKDYAHLLDRNLVIENYKKGRVTLLKAGDIIKDIIDTYTTGFTYVNVADGVNIESIVFNYDQVSKAIQQIADQIGYDWYVDQNKDVHFFSKESLTSPFGLTDTDTDGSFVWNSLIIEKNISQLKNSIYVRGGDETFTISAANGEIYKCDGVQRFFNLAHSFDADTNFAVEKSTDGGSNWTSLNEGNYGVDSEDDYDVLYDPNKKFIVFKEGTQPANADRLRISGKYTLPVLVHVQDDVSIASYGEFQYRIVDKGIKSKEQARQRAQKELENYGKLIYEGNFKTQRTGLAVGQQININSTIRGVNSNFKITKVITTILSPKSGKLEYEVSFIGSEDLSMVDVLTKLLVTDPNKNITILDNEILDKIYNVIERIGISESITRQIASSISETMGIGENVRKDPFGAGVEYTWVLGPYTPTDLSDAKRPIWCNRGGKVI